MGDYRQAQGSIKTKLGEINRICNKIGLQNFGDIAFFIEKEKQPNETLLDALQRYEVEFDLAGKYVRV